MNVTVNKTAEHLAYQVEVKVDSDGCCHLFAACALCNAELAQLNAAPLRLTLMSIYVKAIHGRKHSGEWDEVLKLFTLTGSPFPTNPMQHTLCIRITKHTKGGEA